MKREIIDTVLTVLVILALIVIIFLLLSKILGKSPSSLELLIAIVSGLILNTIRTEYSRGKFEGQFLEFQESVKNSFIRVREDIKEVKDFVRRKS